MSDNLRDFHRRWLRRAPARDAAVERWRQIVADLRAGRPIRPAGGRLDAHDQASADARTERIVAVTLLAGATSLGVGLITEHVLPGLLAALVSGYLAWIGIATE